MSDAKVEFLDLNYEPTTDRTEFARFGFACPMHKDRRCEGLLLRSQGFRPSWEWDGNETVPTFAPSVNCPGCWHGFIENGRCVNTSKADEPEPV